LKLLRQEKTSKIENILFGQEDISVNMKLF